MLGVPSVARRAASQGSAAFRAAIRDASNDGGAAAAVRPPSGLRDGDAALWLRRSVARRADRGDTGEQERREALARVDAAVDGLLGHGCELGVAAMLAYATALPGRPGQRLCTLFGRWYADVVADGAGGGAGGPRRRADAALRGVDRRQLSHLVSVVLSVHARGGDVVGVRDVFAVLRFAGLPVSATHANAVVACFARRGDHAAAVRVLLLVPRPTQDACLDAMRCAPSAGEALAVFSVASAAATARHVAVLVGRCGGVAEAEALVVRMARGRDAALAALSQQARAAEGRGEVVVATHDVNQALLALHAQTSTFAAFCTVWRRTVAVLDRTATPQAVAAFLLAAGREAARLLPADAAWAVGEAAPAARRRQMKPSLRQVVTAAEQYVGVLAASQLLSAEVAGRLLEVYRAARDHRQAAAFVRFVWERHRAVFTLEVKEAYSRIVSQVRLRKAA